jgi:hypothetical protein
MQKYQEAIVKTIEELFQRLNNLPQTMIEDERFVTAYLHGALIAARTHQEAKLESLSNAVVNSALPNAPDENLQQMFLNLVDYFTPLHLAILKYYYDDDIMWRKSRVSNPGMTRPAQVNEPETILKNYFTEFIGKEYVFLQAVQDLLNRDLLNQQKTEASMVSNVYFRGHIWPPHITELGKQFIEFITPTLKEGKWQEPAKIIYRGKTGETLDVDGNKIKYLLEDVTDQAGTPIGRNVIFSIASPAPCKKGSHIEIECYQPETLEDDLFPLSVKFLDNLKTFDGMTELPIR